MISKYLEQNILCPKDLNWVQHCVSRIGLFSTAFHYENNLITSGNVYAALKNSVIIHKPIDLSNSSTKHYVQWFLKPDKNHLLISMQCLNFSGLLLSNVHKSIIVMNSPDTRFSRNVFEAVQKLAAHVLSGLKPDKTLLLVF